MKKLLILALLSLPAAAYSQDLEEMPGVKGGKVEAADNAEPVARPSAQKIMSELSTALSLSSKQEERISEAINEKMAQFDRLMNEFDKNSVEEKKWRYKMNANRYEMVKLNRELPDAVREFLDDEQRQSYDELLEAGKKPPAALIVQEPAGEEGGAKPARKKRLVKRRKLPAAGAAAPAAALDDYGSGQVMVDKETQPEPRKKRVLKKRPAPTVEPAEIEEPAGARPTGQEAPAAQEDVGSYP
ncbi:MAG: hypothetical protein AAB359_01725 [Elusimicrobiota bacterium]